MSRNWRRQLLHRTNAEEGMTCSTPEELPGPTGTLKGRRPMLSRGGLRWTLAMTIVVLAAGSGAPTTATQVPGVERTILQRQDLAGAPGYEVLLIEATIPVGGREGRHTHPGTMIGYLTQGSYTLDNEGTFTDYAPGGSLVVGPGKVHEGINRGNTPIKALVTFIVEKGKPLSTPVK